jgi:hypothetical protein
MPDTPKNLPSWSFYQREGKWVLDLSTHVGSIVLNENGIFIARLDDLWEIECPTLHHAMAAMKLRLADSLRSKAMELNALADDLLDPGENPF